MTIPNLSRIGVKSKNLVQKSDGYKTFIAGVVMLKRILGFTIVIIYIIGLCACSSGSSSSPQNKSTCNILTLAPESQTVFSYTNNGTQTGADFSDVPVRPFLVGESSNPTVNWFASNSTGYCQSVGLPVSESVPDILAQIRRVPGSTPNSCATWVTSRFNKLPNEYPVDSYYNELWMVVPYTLDGITIYSLIHNEYHIVPTNPSNVYGNLIAATSNDGGNTFNLYQNTNESSVNLPVIASPFVYESSLNIQSGMWAQTNIIHWGNYYYMLVYQYLPPTESSSLSGMCIYRTNSISRYDSWLGFDATTRNYDIPLVPSYPSGIPNPSQYLCSPVLPYYYQFSWSYNVVLHAFIIVGIDPNYNEIQGNAAFVYTLANLDPNNGILSPINHNKSYSEYFLRYINDIQSWIESPTIDAQFYPSLLDPNSPNLSDPEALSPVVTGDRNFQYSDSESMYLYYTDIHPVNENNPSGFNRDIYRQRVLIESCQ